MTYFAVRTITVIKLKLRELGRVKNDSKGEIDVGLTCQKRGGGGGGFLFPRPSSLGFSIAFKLAALVTSELSLKIIISNVARVLYSTCKFVFFVLQEFITRRSGVRIKKS